MRKKIRKFIQNWKRPKCPNCYNCGDCIHAQQVWADNKFHGFACRINAR